jgi:GDP-4-dehydro-6-deoxy-D-mannose reductase
VKYLITGISGFVGGHYAEYLFAKNTDIRIYGVDIHRPQFDFLKDSYRKNLEFYHGSVLDKNQLRGLIGKVRPDYIINLAAYSSVAYSWENPIECFINNSSIFLNIIEGVRKAGTKPGILSVGSSEEYGIVEKGSPPIKETSLLSPSNPYAVARLAQEHLAKIYTEAYGIPIICTRSFNHIGPRQKDTFVVSSFAKQVIGVKKGARDKIICGDLNIIRDFTDVRDVVRAYDLLLRKGKPGQVYNVCSGEGHKLSEILELLQKKAGMRVTAIERDPNLIRPIENRKMVGSPGKLSKDTGFKRKYTLSQSLKDILDYWDARV